MLVDDWSVGEGGADKGKKCCCQVVCSLHIARKRR